MFKSGTSSILEFNRFRLLPANVTSIHPFCSSKFKLYRAKRKNRSTDRAPLICFSWNCKIGTEFSPKFQRSKKTNRVLVLRNQTLIPMIWPNRFQLRTLKHATVALTKSCSSRSFSLRTTHCIPWGGTPTHGHLDSASEGDLLLLFQIPRPRACGGLQYRASPLIARRLRGSWKQEQE